MSAPLADRMRPRSLDEVVGQDQVLGAGKPLRRALEDGKAHSMVLWGPPGSGKTTLARLIAQLGVQGKPCHFIALSAVLGGVKEVRAAVEEAQQLRAGSGQRTVLFVDEVHRFNKSQQDAFLPHVEDGTLTFVGATTENPSFELNSALLSRARVYVLKALDATALRQVIDRALADAERGLGASRLTMADAERDALAQAADGDARRALNLLEIAAELAGTAGTIDAGTLGQVIAGGGRRFDKRGELFHDQISALHKSVRGSDPDAALYWMVRMIDGGCDPLYLARRVVRMASEDVGNADPRALALALDAWDVVERLGAGEGELALAQAVVYLSVAPKSNAVYAALNAVKAEVASQGTLEVPAHLRNAPTKLMKELGHGRGYRYAHDEPDAYAAGERYFPDGMPVTRYYHPVERGLEAKIAAKLAELRARDAAATKEGGR